MATSSYLKSTVFRRTAVVVLLLALVAASCVGLVGWYANSLLTRGTEKMIEAEAAELKAELVARGFDALAIAVGERSRRGGASLYYLADANGQWRAGNLTVLPTWSGASGRGTFTYPSIAGATRTSRVAAGLLIDIDGRPRLVIGRDVDDQRALLDAIFRTTGLAAVLLALLGLVGSVVIAHHVQHRIAGMSAATRHIMSGDLSRRLPLDGSGDELDRLSMQLNDMLARIEELMTGLREVSDNIAHDLKTPLNRLRNSAEAALAAQSGAEAWKSGLERVIDEADGLIKTFNALLMIARLEAGSGPDAFETVEIGALARDVHELYEPVADDAGVQLTVDVTSNPVSRVNRHLLGQALANLIDNALKYGVSHGRPGQIGLGVSQADGFARIVVSDNGPGVAESERDRVLRRFVRLEASRSKPGTGLGLSLVAAVARIYKGRIKLEDNAPGLRVVLELPLA